MTFGGTFGAGGNLIPFALIFNLKGEAAAGYDAADRIQFTSKSGQVYTPDRVDTLLVAAASAGEDPVVPPLAALIAGAAVAANADVGTLASGIPGVTEHGLPANFGPGRGRWDLITGTGNGPGPFSLVRLRITYEPQITAPALAVAPAGSLGQGSVMMVEGVPVAPANIAAVTRNFFGVGLDRLTLIIECLHSIQD